MSGRDYCSAGVVSKSCLSELSLMICTHLQAFEKSTYPVKTNQGYWMVELVNFHIDAIMKSRVCYAFGVIVVHSITNAVYTNAFKQLI